MKKKRKKTKRLEEEVYDDGEFMFIAGYTEGGAPYGVTWEEAGIDPDLPLEEKRRLAAEQDAPRGNEGDDEELPFN